MTIVTATYRKKVKRNVILIAITFIAILLYGAIMQKPPAAETSKESLRSTQSSLPVTQVLTTENTQTQTPAVTSRRYIPAGAIACSEVGDAAQTANLRRVSSDMAVANLYPSCFIVGDDLEVRVIRRQNQYQFPLVLVGNPGGAVWVSADEVL